MTKNQLDMDPAFTGLTAQCHELRLLSSRPRSSELTVIHGKGGLPSIFPTSPPTGLTLQMKRPNPQKYRNPPKVTTQIRTRGNSSDPWTVLPPRHYRLDYTHPTKEERSGRCGGKASEGGAVPSGSLAFGSAATSTAIAAGG
ncbi:hypothetical protein R6Z07F_008826 [Ovis aries]